MRRTARGRGFVAACAVALALAGCAGRRTAAPTPGAAPPPVPAGGDAGAAASLPTAREAAGTTARPASPVTAPWDTAARAMATRRAHVYPQGESALGKKLVASLPDPAGVAASEGEGDAPAAPDRPARPASPGSAPDCWEAQLLATADAARAERVRAEAAALLGVVTRIVTADGMHRVRAGGCLDADAALRLVERARAEGWPAAFRVQGRP